MKVYSKVLNIIKNSPQYGHALANIRNRENLIIAKAEIERLLTERKTMH